MKSIIDKLKNLTKLLELIQKTLDKMIPTLSETFKLNYTEQDYLDEGNRLTQSGQFKKAVKSFNQAIKMSPQWGAAYFYRGNVWQCLNNYQQSIEDYQQAIQYGWNSPDVYFNLGNVITQVNEIEEAINNYKQAIQLQNDFLEAYRKCAELLEQKIYLKDALEYYKKILLISPDYPGIKQKIIKVFLAFDRIDIDLESLPDYLGFYPNPDIIVGFLNDSSKVDRITLLCELVLQKKQESFDYYYALGILNELQKQYQSAIDNYQKALSLNPENDNLKRHLINLSIVSNNSNIFQDKLNILPDDKDKLFNIANILKQKNNPQKAIEIYQKILNDDANCVQAYLELGMTFESIGNLLGASNSYQKILDIQPKHEQVRYRLNAILFNIANILKQKNNPQKAIEIYQKILNDDANCVQAYLELGMTFESIGNLLGASNSYQKILDIQPKHEQVRYRLNAILIAQGKIEDVVTTEPLFIQLLSRILTILHIQILVVGAERIGHLACDTDAYLKEGLLKLRSPRFTVMLVPEKVANQHLLDYWKKYLTVIKSNSLHYWFRDGLSTKIPHLNAARYSGVMYNAARYQNFQNQWKNRSPLLELTETDRQRGWNCLNQLGIPSDAWFVCIHCRESNYIKDSTHDYRDGDINNYMGAVEAIVEQGGWCIRMGDPTMTKLPTMERVIDYAHLDIKSEWMDIFLCASCQFFLGSSSGLAWVATVFGKPSACANQVPLSVVLPYTPGDLGIPKLYWSAEQSRYLTFQEILDSPMGNFRYAHLYENAGIEVQENSRDEIRDLALEMLDRLEGKVLYTKEDNHLQNQFQSLLKPEHYCYGVESRIGRDFLRKYSVLLSNEE